MTIENTFQRTHTSKTENRGRFLNQVDLTLAIRHPSLPRKQLDFPNEKSSVVHPHFINQTVEKVRVV